MQLGFLGLGKMGFNMVLRLLEQGHTVHAWNRSPEPRAKAQTAGAKTYGTIGQLVDQLPAATGTGQKVVFIMLTAGDPVEQAIFGEDGLAKHLKPNDIIVDAGNSFYQDSIRRAERLTASGMRFVDMGTSGGPGGARNGACLMVGGSRGDYDTLEPLLRDIAAPEALQFFPGHGAGHFVKMVHNGIEYGMMQALAEGFAVLRQSPFKLDLAQVAELYNRRSVIESRLVEWLRNAYQQHGEGLDGISGEVAHSGEGQWTVETAQALGVPVPVIERALQFRQESPGNPSYTGQVLSALRNQFGQHEVTVK